MDDTDTATIELDRGEARRVINALSNYEFTVPEREGSRASHVREFLQREFDFKDDHFEGTVDIVETFLNVFEYDDEREVRLSRDEAAAVVSALVDLEVDVESAEAEEIAAIRNRFEAAFDLGGDGST